MSGTLVKVQAARATGVENSALVSTDKSVQPTSVIAASKRLAELICEVKAQRGGCCIFSMARFGNVLGASGSIILRIQEQIERGGPVTVIHRGVTRYFMTIPEAAQIVIEVGAMAKGGDLRAGYGQACAHPRSGEVHDPTAWSDTLYDGGGWPDRQRSQ